MVQRFPKARGLNRSIDPRVRNGSETIFQTYTTAKAKPNQNHKYINVKPIKKIGLHGVKLLANYSKRRTKL